MVVVEDVMGGGVGGGKYTVGCTGRIDNINIGDVGVFFWCVI